jgi:hypothetical protein
MDGLTKEKQVTVKSTPCSNLYEIQTTTRREVSHSTLSTSISHPALNTSNSCNEMDTSFTSSCCTKCHCKERLQSTSRNHSTLTKDNHDSKTSHIKKK